MILLTSGFPKSGKSTLVKELSKYCAANIIDPNDYISSIPKDEYQNLTDDEKSTISINSWELSTEDLFNSIHGSNPKDLIIFDTCCSKFLQIKSHLAHAKTCGHEIYFVFVNSDLEIRQDRVQSELINKLENKYAKDFEKSLPMFKKFSDQFIIYNNNKSLEDLNEFAKNLAEKIKSTLK